MINNNGHKMALVTSSGNTVQLRLEINPKARRLILRIDERQRQAVAVAPCKSALNEALSFAQSRADWLYQQISTLPDLVPVKAGGRISLRGEACLISLEGSQRSPRLDAGPPLTLHVPGAEETVGKRVERFLRQSARQDLSHSIARACAQLDVPLPRFSLKDTRTRWGSCTSDGKLSFSWRLIMAPANILDYVAAHECAHLLEMNHSQAFWAHVARCRPDWPGERRWLRQNGHMLQAVRF